MARWFGSCAAAALCTLLSAGAWADAPHNLILFVPDGLRAGIVNDVTAPTLARLRQEGVSFGNSHSLFPTFTTANAAAFATGHGLGDTGDFSNSIYTRAAIQGTVTPFLESDAVQRDLNAALGGNYLDEPSIIALLAAHENPRFSSALIGKLGPVAIFDPAGLAGTATLIVDDSTGQGDQDINGPTSMTAIRVADGALAAIEQELKTLGLYESTNIIVAADHGFSTIAKDSEQGARALPPGFLAVDLAAALQKADPRLKLYDPDDGNRLIDPATAHPSKGNGLIGRDPQSPQVVVAANGGSDLIYLPALGPNGPLADEDGVTANERRRIRKLGAQIARALVDRDYVSGLFVDDQKLGRLPGSLTLADIGLEGQAKTPHPAIVVNFRSYVARSDFQTEPVLCAHEIADTTYPAGGGMHGSFSRADTWNFMAARGPDFRLHYVDELPVSNADVGTTIADLLQLRLTPKGSLQGRILTESLRLHENDPLPEVTVGHAQSPPAPNGLRTMLSTQSVGTHTYYDAAGFLGRTVGLSEATASGQAISSPDRPSAEVTPVMLDIEAHRGGRALRPENTLASFANALSMGVDTLELDMGVTRDQVIVVSHERWLSPDLARGPDGAYVAAPGIPYVKLTLAEVKQYDVGQIRPGSAYAAQFPDQVSIPGTRVPTLAEVIALVRRSGDPRVRLNIETKIDPDHPDQSPDPQHFVSLVLALLRREHFSDRVMIQSFDWRTLRLVQQQAPGIPTVYLTEQQGSTPNIYLDKPSAWTAGFDPATHGGSVPRAIKAAGGAIWSPYFGDVDAALIEESHRLGLKVVVWTVNQPDDMARMIDLKVDGIISDRPDLLRSVGGAKGVTLPRPYPVTP